MVKCKGNPEFRKARNKKCLQNLKQYNQLETRTETFKREDEPVESAQDPNQDIDSQGVNWNQGRRIVELGLLAKQLQACWMCHKGPLDLTNIEGETRYGLGSLLKVKCTSCGGHNKISTGKRHQATKSSSPTKRCWDINSKAAIGNLYIKQLVVHLSEKVGRSCYANLCLSVCLSVYVSVTNLNQEEEHLLFPNF